MMYADPGVFFFWGEGREMGGGGRSGLFKFGLPILIRGSAYGVQCPPHILDLATPLNRKQKNGADKKKKSGLWYFTGLRHMARPSVNKKLRYR